MPSEASFEGFTFSLSLSLTLFKWNSGVTGGILLPYRVTHPICSITKLGYNLNLPPPAQIWSPQRGNWRFFSLNLKFGHCVPNNILCEHVFYRAGNDLDSSPPDKSCTTCPEFQSLSNPCLSMPRLLFGRVTLRGLLCLWLLKWIHLAYSPRIPGWSNLVQSPFPPSKNLPSTPL